MFLTCRHYCILKGKRKEKGMKRKETEKEKNGKNERGQKKMDQIPMKWQWLDTYSLNMVKSFEFKYLGLVNKLG